MVELSVIVPVYECEACLRELHRRLTAAVGSITADYELIFVEDRSSDRSWSVIVELAGADPAVKGYRLSHNFGQHAAITAGITHSTGDLIVVIDCDLQEPPEEIPRLFARAQEGFDVVFAKRRTNQASFLYRAARSISFALFYLFTRTRMEGDYSTLSMMSRKVANAYVQLRDRNREHILILLWLGFDATSIEFGHQKRFAGTSSYTLRTLLRLSFDRLFFQTTVLLRWIVYLGFCLAVAGGVMAAYFIASKILNTVSPGWTSLAVFTLTIGGFVIVSTGVTGLYIGKIFDQVKERPLFVVSNTTAEELASSHDSHGIRR